MRTVQGVSYPRSGHHLVVRLLGKYFGKLWDCGKLSSWNEEGAIQEFRYCEYYNHCKVRPCPSNVHLQKNHDYRLELPVDPKLFYLVQYRDPIPAIVSSFELYRKSPLCASDSKQTWERYSRDDIQYYVNFLKKWVIHRTENVLLLKYEDLLSAPHFEMERVLKFLFPSHEVQGPRLKSVLESERIEPKNQVERFDYFNQDQFRSLEKLLESHFLVQ